MSEKKTNKELIKELMVLSKKVDKDLSKYTSTLDNNCYSNIEEYIDTGSYMLNRLITGSIYNGIPRGRVFGLAGESGVGKSYMCGQLIKKAQEDGYLVLVYDSENAINSEFLSRIGCDTSEIVYVPIDGIEQFRNHVINTLKPILTENPEQKILVVLDSYGNLSCAKELRDLEDNKDNSDMGCFVPDTLVRTSNGNKKIQDIIVGDVVVTHLGRERKVTNKFEYNDKEKKIQIDTGNEVIEVTPEHKMLVYCYDENKLLWKEAKYITVNDKLVKQK